MKKLFAIAALSGLLIVGGCEKKDEKAGATDKKEAAAKPEAKAAAKPEAKAAAKPEANAAAKPEANAAAKPEATAKAEIGKPAPDFTLKGLDGAEWKLSDHKGKIVVLEWFSPSCPYVKIAHEEGRFKTGAAELMKKDVVYVAINSNAEGKPGFGVEANKKGKETFGMTHPVLLDPEGKVGRTYRATRTPHMMVIDQKGVLAYRGALDNSQGGEASDAPGGLKNYVTAAVAELQAGKSVTESENKPWGCGVKYAN